MLNRRELMKLGLYGGTGGLLHLARLKSGALAWVLDEDDDRKDRKDRDDGREHRHRHSPAVVPFTVSLPLPPVKRKVDPSTLPNVPLFSTPTSYYEVHMRQAPVQIFPGKQPTVIWGFDGMYPGPTFDGEIGERVVVRMHNDLGVTVITHHHGAHAPAESDGSALWSQQIPPGGYRDYVYPNDDDIAATHWYHDHDIDFTGHNVFMGLAGMFLLHDQVERNLNLPGNPSDPPLAGELPYDLPMVVQDRTFDANAQLVYNPFSQDGFIGDTFMVNGAVQPSIRVANRKYRLRFLNGSNARFYRLSLNPPLPFHVIGSEGGLFTNSVQVDSFQIAPAERVEAIVDFSSLTPAPNTQVFLNNCLLQTNGRGPDGITTNCTPICCFDIEFSAPDPSSNPQTLRTDLPVFNAAESVTTRDWLFNRSQGAWQVNNKFFDPGPPPPWIPPAKESPRIDATVRVGTTEIWRLKNGGGGWYHPIHIHRNQFRILDRNGVPPGPLEQGLKDSIVLNPGETVRTITKFTGAAQIGRYVMHCHNIEHEDMAMMVVWEVVP